MSDKQLMEALNDCIDCLGQGATLEQCLSQHPDLADELRPLLQSGLATTRARATHPEVQAARHRMAAHLEDTLDNWEPRRPPRLNLWQVAAVAAAALIIGVLALLLQGGDEMLPQSGDQPTHTVAMMTASPDQLDVFAALASFRAAYNDAVVVRIKLEQDCWTIWTNAGLVVCVRADDGSLTELVP